ncbi:MAG: GNAT family N-acetyltransferase [Spirochaetaceae bacterium]|nr:MAG: GNAT family N-acetyltransferase [Spirochaetaceae bacterium]
MRHAVTTTHLIMNAREKLRPRLCEALDVVVRIVDPPDAQINHLFFMEIGTPYRWFSRLGWDFAAWRRYAEDPSVETWVGSQAGVPFGYFELQNRGAVTEIMFFGVLGGHGGRGLGGHLLTRAIERAWQLPGTERVCVHTCTSDHPAALSNYLARGFTAEREVTDEEEMPDDDDPIWSSPGYYRSLRAAPR